MGGAALSARLNALLLVAAVLVTIIVLFSMRSMRSGSSRTSGGVFAGTGARLFVDDTGIAAMSPVERCDKLCEYYDKSSRDVRTELGACGLPANVSQRYMDVVYFGCADDYTDTGTFRFALRSLMVHASTFVRRVFIVAPLGDKPAWLDVSHPRVRYLGPDAIRRIMPPYMHDAPPTQLPWLLHAVPTLSDPFLLVDRNFVFVNNATWDTYSTHTQQLVHFHDARDRTVAALGERDCNRNMHLAGAAEAKRLYGRQPEQLKLGAAQPMPVSHFVARDIVHRMRLFASTAADRKAAFASFYPWVADAMSRGTAVALPGECVAEHAIGKARVKRELLQALSAAPTCVGSVVRSAVGVTALREWEATLAFVFPQPAPFEIPSQQHVSDVAADDNNAASAASFAAVPFVCEFAPKLAVKVHAAAFGISRALLAGAHIPAAQRLLWRVNEKRANYADLMRLVPPLLLQHVDIDNRFVTSAPAPVQSGVLSVAEFNMERGQFWCEAAAQIAADASLAAVDFWLLNEMDLGMARSGNVHTTRLLASALRMNYAWGVEFIELTRGTETEQKRTEGRVDTWGLHGNAILSRWPLSRGSMVRLQDMEEYFTGSPHEPGEKRLAGRMALFAQATVARGGGASVFNVTLVAMHMTTKWADRAAHVDAAVKLIKDRIASYGNKVVFLGGDTWTFTCERLGMVALVKDRVGVNMVNDKGKLVLGNKWRDDYICAHGVDVQQQSEPVVVAAGFAGGSGSMVAISDHPIVTVKAKLARHLM